MVGSQIWEVQRDWARYQVVLQGNDAEGAGVLILFRIVQTATLGVVRVAEAQWSVMGQLVVVVVAVPNRAAVAVEVAVAGGVAYRHLIRTSSPRCM